MRKLILFLFLVVALSLSHGYKIFAETPPVNLIDRYQLLIDQLKAESTIISVDGNYNEPYGLTTNEAIVFIILKDKSDLDSFFKMDDYSQEILLNDIHKDHCGEYYLCRSVNMIVVYDHKKYAEFMTGSAFNPGPSAIVKYPSGVRVRIIVQDKQKRTYKDYYDKNSVDVYPIDFYLNGAKVAGYDPPLIANGRVLIPLRRIMTAMGYSVLVSADSKNITILNDKKEINIKTGDVRATINKEAFNLTVPCNIYYEEPYLSFRDLPKLTACNTFWDSSPMSVYVTMNPAKSVSLSSLKDSIKCLTDAHIDLAGKKFEEALADFDKSIEFDPFNMNAYYEKANMLAELGRYEDALGCLDKIIEIEPYLTSTYQEKANLLVLLDRTQEAADCYNAMTGSEPVDSEDLNAKGDFLFKIGLNEEALSCYEKAIELSSTPNAYYYYNKGTALFYLDQYDKAIVAYDEALAINPAFKDALRDKAHVLMHMGQFNDARILLEAAYLLDAYDPELLCGLGNTFYYQLDYQNAITYYEKAIIADPAYYIAYSNKGYALLGSGDLDESKRFFDIAIALESNYADSYYGEAMVYSILGQNDLALDCLAKAIQLDPSFKVYAETEKAFSNIRGLTVFSNLLR